MGTIVQQMFPQNYQDLNREIPNHPELVERLQNHPANEFEVRLAEVASYCDVILDGQYMPSELDHLAGILYKKLWNMRKPLILLN